MNKNLKEILHSIISIGIVFIITGIVLKFLHRPDSDVYITIGTVFTVLLTVVAFVEIILSKSMNNLSKAVWAVCLLAFNPVAVLVYFYKRQEEQKKSDLIVE